MKKTITLILALAMILSLCACGKQEGKGESENSVITLEKLITLTTPLEITKKCGKFTTTATYTNTGDDYLEGASVVTTYELDSGIYKVLEAFTYSDGETSYTYHDSEANYMYSTSGGDTIAVETKENLAKDIFEHSLASYSEDATSIKDIKNVGTTTIVNVETNYGEDNTTTDEIVVDNETGNITKITSTYASYKGEGETTYTIEFDYDTNIAVTKPETVEASGNTVAEDIIQNTTPDVPVANPVETQTPSVTPAPTATPAPTQAPVTSYGSLYFSTTDINGNAVTSDMMASAKIVLLNLWEPWCGPCVREMPDLQKLYDNYKDKGLLIIGAYASTGYDQDAKDIVSSKGITYPIIKCDSNIMYLEQDYVPATYLLDGSGNILVSSPYAGAKDYASWESIVLAYLK